MSEFGTFEMNLDRHMEWNTISTQLNTLTASFETEYNVVRLHDAIAISLQSQIHKLPIANYNLYYGPKAN